MLFVIGSYLHYVPIIEMEVYNRYARKEQSEEEASKEDGHVFKFGIPFLYVLLVGLVAVDFSYG